MVRVMQVLPEKRLSRCRFLLEPGKRLSHCRFLLEPGKMLFRCRFLLEPGKRLSRCRFLLEPEKGCFAVGFVQKMCVSLHLLLEKGCDAASFA